MDITDTPLATDDVTAPAPNARVRTITLGCRLNTYESQAMRDMAEKGAPDCDTIIINTCAVTNEAVRQARQTIRRARRENPYARVVVTGCAAQIDPDSFAAMGEIDLIIGNAEKMKPDSWQAANLGADAPRVRVSDIMSVRETASHLIDGLADRARAYVEVQNGCDHRCTFCTIPFGRGNSRSAPAGEVVTQIRHLAGLGVPEVVLSGVDLTSWGADLPGKPQFGNLVARILKLVPDLPRLRLSSLDAIEIDDELLDLFAHEPRLMPHVHLSLQAGDDMILKRMKRRHSTAQALEMAAKLRAVRPDIAFGADIIAGFPTEDDQAFANTCQHVRDMQLAFLHVFPFSPRKGTPAARMPATPKPIIKARAETLRGIGAELLAQHLARHVGTTYSILVEKAGIGRLSDFTLVRFAEPAEAGSLRSGQILRADTDRLEAVLQ